MSAPIPRSAALGLVVALALLVGALATGRPRQTQMPASEIAELTREWQHIPPSQSSGGTAEFGDNVSYNVDGSTLPTSDLIDAVLSQMMSDIARLRVDIEAHERLSARRLSVLAALGLGQFLFMATLIGALASMARKHDSGGTR